jgi:hypothetical protein
VRLRDVGAGDELGTRFDGKRNQQCVELDAPNHQRRCDVRLNNGRLAIGSFEIQPRHVVGHDPRELTAEVGKSSEHPRADAAAARFVTRKRRAVQQSDGDPGQGEGPGGSRAGGTRADHDDRPWGRRVSEHFNKP